MVFIWTTHMILGVYMETTIQKVGGIKETGHCPKSIQQIYFEGCFTYFTAVPPCLWLLTGCATIRQLQPARCSQQVHLHATLNILWSCSESWVINCFTKQTHFTGTFLKLNLCEETLRLQDSCLGSLVHTGGSALQHYEADTCDEGTEHGQQSWTKTGLIHWESLLCSLIYKNGGNQSSRSNHH